MANTSYIVWKICKNEIMQFFFFTFVLHFFFKKKCSSIKMVNITEILRQT